MLSIRNLTKSYKTANGRHYVFKDISLDFPENANIGILGPNGAGKSTLLRILGGIDYPDAGQIRCNKSMSWPLGLRGGFVGNLSGRDNCRMICNIYGLPPRQINLKLEAIKELSGIGTYFEEPVKYYSSGMGSRIGFALSMAFDFEILLIDEITAVGDRHFRETAKQAIEDKRGRSNVIMVSHSMGSIRDFCDTGVLLRDGKLTLYPNIEDAVRAYLPQDTAQPARDLTDETAVEINSDFFTATESAEISNLRRQIDGRFKQIEQALAEGDAIKDEGSLHHLLGNSYARLQDLSKARKHQEIALEERPENPGFHVQLITTLLQLRELEAAETAIQTGLDLWPERAPLLKMRGALHMHRGNYEEAYGDLLKAVELTPDNAQFRHVLAQAMLLKPNPDLDAALQHCLKAIELNHEQHLFQQTLSRILAAQGEYSESVKALREANLKQQQLHQEEQVCKREITLLRGILTQLEKAHELVD